MRTPEEQRAHNKWLDENRCKHFSGIQHKTCRAGIAYTLPIVESSWSCYGRSPCPGYALYTAEEIAAKEAESERFITLLDQGLSACCEAPLDKSRVIPSGKYKGHGPRLCSKCGEVVFIV